MIDKESKMPMHEYANLFDLAIRGALAQAFMKRKYPLTKNYWDLLDGKTDITMRDVGEILYELDFEMEFRLIMIDKNDKTGSE